MREAFEREDGATAEPTLPSVSLRIKLALFAAALIVVPGVIFALIVQRSEQASLQDLIGRHLAREAQHTADRLGAILRSEREALRSFAHQDLMREILVDDLDKRISAALATLRDGDAVRIDYLVANRAERVIASSNPDLIGAAPAWGGIEAAIRSGAEQVVGPVARDASAHAVLVVTAAIPDPDDRTRSIGTLVGLYDWPRLIEVTETVRRELAEQGTHARVVVATSAGAIVGGTTPPPGSGAELADGWLRPVEARLKTDAGFAVLDASELLIGFAPFGVGGTRWQLVIAERLADAQAPAHAQTRRLATTLAVTLILALFIAAIAGRRVVQPLTELTAAIGSVSQGDLSSLRVAVRSDDEVGSLARALNQMATELDQAHSDLVEAAKYALVGELAAGVAHEVRTSLGVVRSSTQMLERQLPADADPHAVELAQLIREEIDRLGAIINDLLELGRPRALHLEPIQITSPLQRAIGMIESNAAEKQVSVELDAPDSLPDVRCDPELLFQVALNLLVNAVQAVEAGGDVKVTVRATGDGYVRFEVRDDGPGIPETLRGKLFRPFATGREGGIGLGLTFVQRVVYEHQGRIHVESEPGHGARFRIDLPSEGSAA